MFAGRYDELVTLEKGLYQTKHGQPSNYLITGDRGIGKTSLLLYLKRVSDGGVDSLEHGNFDFVSFSLLVSDKLDVVTMLKLAERNITRELGKLETVRNFLAETWAFVQRLRVMDSGISAAEQDSEVELQIDNFAYSLAATCNRVVNPERGERKKGSSWRRVGDSRAMTAV